MWIICPPLPLSTAHLCSVQRKVMEMLGHFGFSVIQPWSESRVEIEAHLAGFDISCYSGIR